MASEPGRRDDAACIIVNIDRERDFWKRHYSELPCRQAGLGFEACWPLLIRAYHVYLHHPNAGREVGAVLFANSPEAIDHGLEPSLAGRIFARVMDRIQRATTRLQYPMPAHA
ncbi:MULTISPECIES: hypothetical protein [Pseudoxanthomonas]|jgi:hypothetical protein|nr:hypothetical protein [Pseudoxanthomonas winnipegensis]TAA09881.1 hypothetical protein EA659_09980 [Pseudoxanthomonas winnipegensis]TAA22739.1 hypothetical protein EA658_03935 [Pseudoxanthomonas winnipegensis]TAA43217.1 hypothetical protein EAT51_06000 [Pseudoxanthomonas winnipegensis]TAH73151.1 hypothetical protein EA657_05475 [Pseudoxanthomonas winnipegensis]TBV76981.1 hypothetical protein EYC45_02095 [Pseudoxanthomonas winnipegensis]